MKITEEDTPSKFPEIVKNIADSCPAGDNDKAMAAVQEARLSNPSIWIWF